jgi:hypothetical protein
MKASAGSTPPPQAGTVTVPQPVPTKMIRQELKNILKMLES